MTAVVVKRKCPAQNDLCQAIPACPNNAISYHTDDNEPLGGKIVVDTEKCNDCGACVQACCGQAMEIQ
jgi:Fe-S-cluster-containing hydrogenase component 2